MANPLRGEVWLVDLGMVAKISPAWFSVFQRMVPTIVCSQLLLRTRRLREDRPLRSLFRPDF
jgi:hypothetical protein